MPPPDFSSTRNEFERSQRTWGYFRAWLKDEPGQFLFLCQDRLKTLFALLPVYVRLPPIAAATIAGLNAALYMFGIAGAILVFRRRVLLELLLIQAYVYSICIISVSSPRYRSPADLALILVASLALNQLSSWLIRKRVSR